MISLSLVSSNLSTELLLSSPVYILLWSLIRARLSFLY